MTRRSLDPRSLAGAALAAGLLVAVATPAHAGGGNVMPPTAKPSGYSLAEMASEMAYFSTSGNDLAYYPDTPFQILYTSATNVFEVGTGTKFFVPVAWVDDSPPVLGAFPADPSLAEDYFFGAQGLGAYAVQIEVDRKVSELVPAYLAGPVLAPGLLDGGGSHFIQIGAFLTPLSKGRHTVKIRASFDGEAIGGPPGFSFEIAYTVIVN